MQSLSRRFRRGAAFAMMTAAVVAAASCSSGAATGGAAPKAPSGAATSGAAAKTPSGSPIVVGALGSFTGAGGSSTASGEVLLQDWVQATNASGGINGHPVKAIILDDQNSPSVALSNAKQLVDQDHVIAVLDLSEDQESTWAPAVDAAGVPVIGQAESPVFGTDPNFYPTGTTVVPLIWGELKAASLKHVTGLAAFYCAEIASCSQTVPLVTAVGAPLGVKLKYSAKVSSSAASYTPQCLGAKNAGANGGTAVVAGQTGLLLAESCAAQGFKPVWVTTGGEMTTPWLTQPAVNGAIGNVQDVPWFDNSIPATKFMQASIKTYSPSLPTSSSFGANATQAWAAAVVFGAVATTGGIGPNSTPAQLITALHHVSGNNFGGVTPPLTYTAGKPTTVPCSFVVGISNGNWTEPTGLKTICQPAP
jgi:branched-chain amino acid transport system substrate-binding protein